MFRPSTRSVQKSLLDLVQTVPEYVLDMLRNSWAEDFYKLIFSQINEERLDVLYGDKASRPN